MHVHNTYNMSGISSKDRKSLDEMSDADRLAEIREWQRRLARAHTGGYQLADMKVRTVVDNVAWLLAVIDERPGA